MDTGSGDIYAEQTGEGDVKAQTGSGRIELKDIHGSLRAGTGSGDIKISGSPGGRLAPRNRIGKRSSSRLAIQGLRWMPRPGSGTVHTDHEMSVQGSFDRHHIVGKINGGGPTVRIQTGSGDVRIH